MSFISPQPLLAATSDSGVLLHDILGGIAVAVLVLIAVVAYKRMSRGSGPGSDPQGAAGTGATRSVGVMYIGAIFCVALAAVVAFFFVMPRATRQKGEASKVQTAGDKSLP